MHEKPFRLDERVAYYTTYWNEMERIQGKPENTQCPSCHAGMQVLRGQKGLDSDNPDDWLWAYGCTNRHVWVYCNAKDRTFYIPERQEDRDRLDGFYQELTRY